MDLQTNQTISDDQELAKVLAGVSTESDGMEFEETNAANDGIPAVNPATISPDPTATPTPDPVTPAADLPSPDIQVTPEPQMAVSDPGLDTIKQTALNELRPLIGKLNVSPEEKFDTYLLLLRSTDDKDLIAPAHQAAISIADEARRAQALLDIIKEIDYLSNPEK